MPTVTLALSPARAGNCRRAGQQHQVPEEGAQELGQVACLSVCAECDRSARLQAPEAFVRETRGLVRKNQARLKEEIAD